MSSWWLAAACLLVGATVMAVWPSGTNLHRLDGPSPARPAAPAPLLSVAAVWGGVEELAARRPGRLTALAAAAAAGIGWILGGPVAAVIGAAYVALAVRALVRRSRRRRTAVIRGRRLDDLCALAANLRAGLPPVEVTGAVTRRPGVVAGGGAASSIGRDAGDADLRIAELTAAVWRLAERTGAPAADLVERIEADARTADRAMTSAAAQAAGAQATALLLAALPLGGIALGGSIGVDPVQVLLHTTLGAACAIVAVLLQCAGLLWSERLTSGPAR